MAVQTATALLVRAALILGVTGVPAAAQTRPASDGDWVGELRMRDSGQFVHLRFQGDTTGATTTLDLPLANAWNVRVAVRLSPGHQLALSFPLGSDTARLAGAIRDAAIDAAGRVGDGVVALHLVRRAAYDSAVVRPLAGNYAIAPDRVVSMGPMDEAGNWLAFVDSKSLRGGILYALDDSTFFTGPTFGIDYPIAIRVTFERTGHGPARALRWEEQGTTRRARRLDDLRQEDVTFRNGDVRLVGNVTVPNTPGRHPAVVLIHGCCGTIPTRDFGYWSSYLAHNGFAVLAFDKRGGGESTGDVNATYEELAADVLAGVGMLQARPDIDPRRVGLFGMSNGGYVAPLAAVRGAGQVAFVAVRAGSARPVGANIDYEVGNDLRSEGFDEVAVEQGVAIRRRVTDFVVRHPELSASAWDSLQTEVRAVSKARWFPWSRVQWVPYVSPSDSGGRAYLNTLRSSWAYDPVPYWRQLRVPVYVMLGGLDRSVPSAETERTLRSAFEAAGNTRATVRLFARGNHGLLVARNGYEREIKSLAYYVPDFQAGLVRWLRANVGEPALHLAP
jgi:dienelactone hydrolase